MVDLFLQPWSDDTAMYQADFLDEIQIDPVPILLGGGVRLLFDHLGNEPIEVVVICGASIVRQCLRAGLTDELHIDVMPVLLCDGLRLFEDMEPSHIQLERLTVMELPAGRTHLRFRIVK